MWKKLSLLLAVLVIIGTFFTAASADEAEAPANVLKLSPATVYVAVGKTGKVTPTVTVNGKKTKASYTWETSDPAVATVKDGKVKGVSLGEATVTCTAKVGKDIVLTGTVAVKVVIPVTSLKLQSPRRIEMKCGSKMQLEYTVLPENASIPKIKWKSSNKTIVKIDSSGKMTALAPGKVKITGTTTDGTKRKVKLTVLVPTLWADQDKVTLTEPVPVKVKFNYYRDEALEEGATVKQAGKCFDYTLTQKEKDCTVTFTPVTPGRSMLVISNKRNSTNKLSFTVTVEESAVPDQFLLQFNSVKIQKRKADTRIDFHIRNTTSRRIESVTVLADYYDRDGIQMVFSGEDGLLTESRRVIEAAMRPRDNYGCHFEVTDPEQEERSIGHVRLALAGVKYADGTEVRIPDGNLYWYDSSLKGYDTRPSITKAVPLATEEIRAKAEGFDLGVTTVPVHSFIAERYAQSEHPGLYITSIAEGSAAEKAKLKPKDIIWKVNKLTWKGHPDLLTEAEALLADGETVTIGVIRDGKAKNIKVKGKTDE